MYWKLLVGLTAPRLYPSEDQPALPTPLAFKHSVHTNGEKWFRTHVSELMPPSRLRPPKLNAHQMDTNYVSHVV